MLLQLRNKSAPKFSSLSLTSIIKQPLNLTDRKGHPSLLSEHFSDVDGSQRCIICKIKCLFIAGLTVEQSGELMAVAETERTTVRDGVLNPVDIDSNFAIKF